MNFALQVVGGGPHCIQFKDIDPNLSIDDFLAFYVHKYRQLAPYQPRSSDGTADVLKYLSHRVSVIRDDGMAFFNLDDALVPPGTVSIQPTPTALAVAQQQQQGQGGVVAENKNSNNASNIDTLQTATPQTVLEAFSFLQDSVYQGVGKGWLHFRDLPMIVHVICKLSPVGIQKNSGTAATCGNMFDIEGTNLLFLTIHDIKKMIAVKVRTPAMELLVIDPENPGEELSADLDLYRYLRCFGHTTLKVVRREGIVAHVRMGGNNVLTLTRLTPTTTMEEVRARLRAVFGAVVHVLYIDKDPSRPTEMVPAAGQELLDSTILLDVSTTGTDVFLSTTPIAAPAHIVSSDGRGMPVNRPPEPRLISHSHTGAGAGALSINHSFNSDGSFHNRSFGGGSGAGPTTQHPPITLRVTIESTTVENGEVFDMILPSDGKPYYVTELKEFVMLNVLPSAAYHQLAVRYGRKILGDHEALQPLTGEQEKPLGAGVVLLTCIWSQS